MKPLICILFLFSMNIHAQDQQGEEKICKPSLWENCGGSGGDHTDGQVATFPYPQCLDQALTNIRLKVVDEVYKNLERGEGDYKSRAYKMRLCDSLCDEYGDGTGIVSPRWVRIPKDIKNFIAAEGDSYRRIYVPKKLRDLISAEVNLLDQNRNENFLYINIDKFLVLRPLNRPKKGDAVDFWGATTLREHGAPIYFTNSSTWLKKIKNDEVDPKNCEQIEDLELTILQEVMDHIVSVEESQYLEAKDLISPELSNIPLSDHLNYSIAYHVIYQSFVRFQAEFAGTKLPGVIFASYDKFLSRYRNSDEHF